MMSETMDFNHIHYFTSELCVMAKAEEGQWVCTPALV